MSWRCWLQTKDSALLRDSPFYNVQLSSYREEGAAFPVLDIIRMQQFDAQRRYRIPR